MVADSGCLKTHSSDVRNHHRYATPPIMGLEIPKRSSEAASLIESYPAFEVLYSGDASFEKGSIQAHGIRSRQTMARAYVNKAWLELRLETPY